MRPASSDELLPLNGSGQKRVLSGIFWARTLSAVFAFSEGYADGSLSGASVLIEDQFKLSALQLGWVVGIGLYAQALSSVAGGWIADVFGRRPAMTVAYVLLIAGALMIAFADGFWLVVIGRTIEAGGMGLGLTTVLTYMAEVAPAAQRGALTGLEPLLHIFGILIGNVMNRVLLPLAHNWRIVMGLGGLFPVIALFFTLMGLLPESPRFLITQEGKRNEAIETLEQLVGREEAIATQKLWDEQAEELANTATWTEVFSPSSNAQKQTILIGLGVLIYKMSCGDSIISKYLSNILAADLGVATAFEITAGVGCMRFVFCLCLLGVVDTIGRRLLLLFSSSLMVVWAGCVVVFYGMNFAVVPWKMMALISFYASYASGVGPMGYIYPSEVLDLRIRCKALSVGYFIARAVEGAITVAWPTVEDSYGVGGGFVIFFVFNVFALICIYLAVPETKGVALEDMHKLFGKATK